MFWSGGFWVGDWGWVWLWVVVWGRFKKYVGSGDRREGQLKDIASIKSLFPLHNKQTKGRGVKKS